jgi:hypothetical protein
MCLLPDIAFAAAKAGADHSVDRDTGRSTVTFDLFIALKSSAGRERPMHRTLLWLGGLFCAIGGAVIAASLLLSVMGLGASYNFGDPTRFEFILVPFWQIELAIAAIGGMCLLAWQRLKRRPH